MEIKPVGNRKVALLFALALTILTAGSVPADDTLPASTYFGGSGQDGWYDVPVVQAPDGTVYLAGSTSSVDIDIPEGGYQMESGGGRDLVIARFSADMRELLAATYLGGSAADAEWPGIDLLVAPDGSVYVCSTSNSGDWPTTSGAYQENSAGNYDIVVARLSADLDQLLASSYVGGSAIEDFPKLALAATGDVLVTCCTTSLDFPTTLGAYSEVRRGGKDLGVVRLDAALANLLAGTYLGSVANDWPEVIRLDDEGDIFLTGWTQSSSFPTTDGAFQQSSVGTYHAFISCLSSDLTALVASTFIGGSNWEFGYGLAVDGAGSVYACGHTASTDFPGTSGGAQPEYAGAGGAGSGDDMWIARFSHDLTTLQAATYLGGSDWENGVGLLLLPDGLIVGGTTNSSDWPVTPGVFGPEHSGGSSDYARDMVLACLDRDLTVIEAATYVGGNGMDNLGGLWIGDDSRFWISGSTSSSDFPVDPAGYDTSYAGGGFDWGGDLVCGQLCYDLTAGGLSPVPDLQSGGLLQLMGACPNPFNPRTEVAFYLAKTHQVRITVHDIAGRLVALLADSVFAAGHHAVAWDGRDERGQSVATGTYLLRVNAGLSERTTKLTLVK